MPIYEYGCECGEVQERLETFIDRMAPPECDLCGGDTEKLISVCSFDLRGGGFYQNEYGNGAEKLGLKDQRRRLLRESTEQPGRTLPPQLQDVFEREVQTSDRDMGMWLERRDITTAERLKQNKKKHEARANE